MSFEKTIFFDNLFHFKIEKTKYRDEVEKDIKVEEENQPPRVYMNKFERRIFDWYIANLEYGNATCIDDLSMKNWDQVKHHQKFDF